MCYMSIGKAVNYYGGVIVKKSCTKFYWAIDNYDEPEWEEIPEYLYKALTKFENERKK